MTVLLVASPGGHIEELRLLLPTLGIDPADAVWVTSRTVQTESLLEGRPVRWIAPVASGQLGRAAASLPAAVRLHRQVRPRLVVSTGAAIAAPHLVAAAVHRVPIWYVDSATRLDGPSVTGRLAERLPRTSLFVQGRGWGDPRWARVPDVFDAYESLPREGPTGPVRSAVVSLGTERFAFDRAVTQVERVLLDRSVPVEVFWQTGNTSVVRDGVERPRWVTSEALRDACRRADVVITHGGVGSALCALAEGKVPILLPRSGRRGEHIDDHQADMVQMLAERGLAVAVDPDELTWEHLERAHALRARTRPEVVAPRTDGADGPTGQPT